MACARRPAAAVARLPRGRADARPRRRRALAADAPPRGEAGGAKGSAARWALAVAAALHVGAGAAAAPPRALALDLAEPAQQQQSAQAPQPAATGGGDAGQKKGKGARSPLGLPQRPDVAARRQGRGAAALPRRPDVSARRAGQPDRAAWEQVLGRSKLRAEVKEVEARERETKGKLAESQRAADVLRAEVERLKSLADVRASNLSATEDKLKEELARERALAAEKRAEDGVVKKLEARIKQVEQGAITTTAGLTVGGVLVALQTLWSSSGGGIIAAQEARKGLLVRKALRTVRWEVADSPGGPVGELRSVELRSNELNALRAAISQRSALFSFREVRRVAQWHSIGGRSFFEAIETTEQVKLLPEGAWLVWTTSAEPFPSSMVLDLDTRGGSAPGPEVAGGRGALQADEPATAADMAMATVGSAAVASSVASESDAGDGAGGGASHGA